MLRIHQSPVAYQVINGYLLPEDVLKRLKLEIFLNEIKNARNENDY